MSNVNKIAKNTLFLYLRMFFNLGVSLYTSRIILQTLGITDFGIYNLVGGVVILFTFINTPMVATTQRFINIEKVSSSISKVNKIFNISLSVHILISIIILILAETVGLWFLNNKLSIPSDRLYSANIVFQFSILVTILNIIRVPYNAIIIAYERMSYYAFLGVLETLLKLFVVYILWIFPNNDKLVLYGALLVLVNFIINCVYFFYCRNKFFQETLLRWYNDKQKSKELLSFSGWMLFGQFAVVGSKEGVSMILNIFNGVVVNASLGIANQVNGIIYSFISNFQVAFNPQLIQTYALREHDRHKMMVLNMSRYSFFLMLFISAPILFYTKSILFLWLGNELPIYVDSFVQIIIFCSLIDALAGPFWVSAQAIGSIKSYNVVLTLINLLTLPLAYFVLELGFSPIYVFLTKFIISIFLQVFRYYFIHKYLKFSNNEFLKYFFKVIIFFVFLVLLILLKNHGEVSFYEVLIGSIILCIFLFLMIFIVGLEQKEQVYIINYIQNKISLR